MKKLLKHGIFALSVALLVTAFMIGCQPPVGDLSWEGYTPPAGFGAARIVAGNNLARTVKPGTIVTDFLSYKLSFTPTAGYAFTNPPATLPIVDDFDGNSTQLGSHTVALLPGTYTLAVTAYMATGQDKAAATASITGIVITEGGTIPIPITLTAYNPSATPAGTGNGDFGWDISGTAALPTAKMAIVPILANGTPTWTTGSEIDLNGSGNANTTGSPYSLIPGKYRIDLTLVNSGGDIVVFPGEQLWVYANMSCEFTFGVQPYMFEAPPGAFVVTFKYLDGATADEPRNTNAVGRLDSLPLGGTYTGHTFLGWYENDGSTGGGSGSGWGSQINTSTTFSSNTTVYARWLTDSFGQGGTVDLNPLGGTEIVVQDTTSGGAAVGNGSTVIVAVNADPHTITIFNAASFSSIQVKKGSITVPAPGGVITLEPTSLPINTAGGGPHFIFITATTADGEVQTFYFTIQIGS